VGRLPMGRRVEGGEGLRAIHRLLGSGVEYRRMDAFALNQLEERFDLVYCFGIMHRVENPLGLLRVLRGRTVSRGTVLLETYGVGPEDRNGPAIRVSEPGQLRARRVRLLGIRGRRPAADCPDCRLLPRRVARRCGGRRPPADHGSAGRLEAPGRRSQQPLHKTRISGRYCRSWFVELSGSSSALIRARSDWRFGAARLLGG
jgi:hypothetical protein